MMFTEQSFNNKKDQQVPTLSLDSVADPTPLLEEILTKEQNTCIQIRDTCTLMAQSVRDVLGSSTPQGGYVQAMQDKLEELEKAVNNLESTIKRKSVFSNDFLDSASQRWFEKRLSSQSRKRRLRNFKRKERVIEGPIYTFFPIGEPNPRYQASSPSSPSNMTSTSTSSSSPPSTPSSPPSVPSPHSPIRPSLSPLSLPSLTNLTVPSTSPNNSPRALSSRGSPSACVPSTPSYSSTPTSATSLSTPNCLHPLEKCSQQVISDLSTEDPQANQQSMSISNIIN